LENQKSWDRDNNMKLSRDESVILPEEGRWKNIIKGKYERMTKMSQDGANHHLMHVEHSFSPLSSWDFETLRLNHYPDLPSLLDFNSIIVILRLISILMFISIMNIGELIYQSNYLNNWSYRLMNRLCCSSSLNANIVRKLTSSTTAISLRFSRFPIYASLMLFINEHN
jgi:hypothetical protein